MASPPPRIDKSPLTGQHSSDKNGLPEFTPEGVTMATIAREIYEPGSDMRFAPKLAIVMALVVIAGFSTQLAMGRSTFGAPLRVHVHAVVFMGWVALFVTQSWLATRGPLGLHRKLGWLAVGWMGLMVAAAMTVIVAMARGGTVPFFFTPQQFLIGDPATLVCFVGLTFAAIARRRETDWHARLHICAMAAIMGPAFGRLLPMPFMIPYSFDVAVAAGLVFPLAGAIRDKRVLGRVHPAWSLGALAIVATLVLTDLIAYSPLGDRVYAATVMGSPGAAIPGLAYPAPPQGPLRTGR
jgi:hypothetical protein